MAVPTPPGLAIDAQVLQRHVTYYNEVYQGGDGSWAGDPQSILRRFNDMVCIQHSLMSYMEHEQT